MLLFNFLKRPLVRQQQPMLFSSFLQLYLAVALLTSKGKWGWMNAATHKNNKQNVFLVSTTTGISKRQISPRASPYALHLPASCKSVFTTVCMMHTCCRRRSLTFLIKMNGNPVSMQACVSAARTLVNPREMQEFPTLAFCVPKIPQLSTKEDQGC